MATVASVITRASRRLEDQEPGYAFMHWQESDLLAGVNYALSIIGRYRPRQFGEVKTYDLPEDGLLHTSCTDFLPPYTLLDRAGRRIRSLATLEETDSAWDIPLCSGAGGPWYLVQRAENTFEAHPVTRGDKYKVRGVCVSIPSVTLTEELPVTGDLSAVVDELLMSYAYSYDKTSDVYTQKGRMHWANAMFLLGVDDGGSK